MGVLAAPLRRRRQRRYPVSNTWESVGPARGVYGSAQGSFVDTNCFFIDKLACNAVFPEWATTRFAGGTGALGRCSTSCAAVVRHEWSSTPIAKAIASSARMQSSAGSACRTTIARTTADRNGAACDRDELPAY